MIAQASLVLCAQVLIPANPDGPKTFITVNKSSQTVSLWQRKSPLQTVWTSVCSTGSENGDKQLEGDLRTPEGVYFLGRRLSGNLGKELYGNLAYALNYPNPVDRLRGKTGYGIWLHGRGKELLPRDTQGCIALNTQELRELERHLVPGRTPVLIGSSCSARNPGQDVKPAAAELKKRLSSWVQSWERRSEQFFEHYHPDRFSQSDPETFTAFRSRKESLFQRYAWIDIHLGQIQIIPGPGYWVTAFGQYFRSPSFESQGMKRLYWQRLGQQDWKIVGREWIPLDLELEEQYLCEARSRVRSWLTEWAESWASADLQAYAGHYHPMASQDGRSGRKAITAHKKAVWSEEKPSKVEVDNVRVDPATQGFRVTFKQHYQGRKGYSDTGIKSLILQPESESFCILRESWRPLPAS
jgi:murein L,D-transpeptidase YafK